MHLEVNVVVRRIPTRIDGLKRGLAIRAGELRATQEALAVVSTPRAER